MVCDLSAGHPGEVLGGVAVAWRGLRGALGTVVLGSLVLVALLSPTPENIGRAANEYVEQNVPDPKGLVADLLAAIVLFVVGLAAWIWWKDRRDSV